MYVYTATDLPYARVKLVSAFVAVTLLMCQSILGNKYDCKWQIDITFLIN